jgi:hypothetical protein
MSATTEQIAPVTIRRADVKDAQPLPTFTMTRFENRSPRSANAPQTVERPPRQPPACIRFL